MTTDSFTSRLAALTAAQETLLDRKNERAQPGNGIFSRFLHPVLTAEHVPLDWRYDFSSKDNPHFMERLGIDAVFNAGALLLEGRYLLMARVEGWDRKSFFAIAESKTGVDGFRFWDEPVILPESEVPATNVYDARLTAHEDGFIYAVFCAERKSVV